MLHPVQSAPGQLLSTKLFNTFRCHAECLGQATRIVTGCDVRVAFALLPILLEELIVGLEEMKVAVLSGDDAVPDDAYALDTRDSMCALPFRVSEPSHRFCQTA